MDPSSAWLPAMTSNKSFLWSLVPGGGVEGVEGRYGAPSATSTTTTASTFLWRSTSAVGPPPQQPEATAGPVSEASHFVVAPDVGVLYDDVNGGSVEMCQELYDDAGFEEQKDAPPEKPARTSSTRSSATSGIWSSPEPCVGDSGSMLGDDGPCYEEMAPPSPLQGAQATTAVSGDATTLVEGHDSSRSSGMKPQEDAVNGPAASRPTSVKLLAMRFEALSQSAEEPRRTGSSRTGRTTPGEPPPPPPPAQLPQPPSISVPQKIVEDGSVLPSAHLPSRSSSSVSSASSTGSSLWGRPGSFPPPLPLLLLPPPVASPMATAVGRHRTPSSSSGSSPNNSPPPSPTTEKPPPPPPLSTLPSRNNSRVQDARPPPLSPASTPHKDAYENIYETLRGSIEMETYANEPLYQIYNQNADELAREYISREFESCSPRRTAPDAVPLSASDGGAPRGLFRTLWCQLPEVRSSHVLETLSAEERKLMEAKFEIITSEASYISSLNILKNHFMVHLQQCDEADFSKEDRRLVFGDVVAVRKVAEKMLSQLESCRKKDVFMHGMLQAIHDIARSDFKIYVDYCAYQNCRTRTMDRLMYQQPGIFAQTLAALEAHPVCQGLTLQSFLLVPMQRITKLQLLLGAVLNCMDRADEEYDICKMALQQIGDVVHECNEGVRSVERMEELLSLSKQFKFDRGVKMLPLYSSNRWLVKKGKVTELNPEWFTAKSIYIFIFNDILFLAKKRKLFPQHVERFLVVDYCNREDVRLMNTEGTLHLPDRLSSGFCMLLTLLKNHREKKVSKLIYFACESDRQRWTDALNPPELGKESKEWPQVVVKWPYNAEQPDELSLQVSDIINVFTKSADGWYQGQRLRDGETGWFPGNYTVDVELVQLREHGTDRNVVMSIYYV